jgi:hypothetical protein
VTDSRYSLLLADNLLRHRRLALDRYFEDAPAAAPSPGRVTVVRLDALSSQPPRRLRQGHYTIERVAGHLHYFFPHAGSLLAVPYVAAMRMAGLAVVDGEDRYLARAEERLQGGLAALLMGLTTGVFFLTARERLPPRPSVALALLAALGTQVWSTTSRVLWSDTWGVALMAVVGWRLVRAAAPGGRVRPYLLGSLLAWAYFVRPTNSIHVALVLVYLAVAHREALLRVTATGAAWGLGFVAHSRATFGTLLPSYFQPRRLGAGHAVEALLANLVSPSRGLVVYAPVVLLAVVLLFVYRRHVREWPLAGLGLAGIAGQFVPVLFFDHWWGGYAYGPRLLSGLVPFALLVAVIAVRAARDAAAVAPGPVGRRRLAGVAVALVCAWSVLVNGRGALVAATGRWNTEPADVDLLPSRVWDWRHPQFLAGLTTPPASGLGPGVRIPLGQAAADGLFEDGWSDPEGGLRWSVAARAAMRVRWPAAGRYLLRLEVRQAPAWYAAGGQPLSLWLDGQERARWHLAEPGPVVLAIPVQSDGDAREHRLELRVPDLPLRGGGADRRPLRTAVYSLRLDRVPVLAPAEAVAMGTGAAAPFIGNGWGEGEGAYRWTVARRAELYFAAASADPAVLRLRLHPFVREKGPSAQRVIVGVDDTLVGTLALATPEATEHAIPLPARGATTRLTLELPDAASPLGEDRDARRLGAAVHWIRLDPMPVLARGVPVAFGAAGAAAYLGEGWAEREGSTRWSDGLRSEILFKAEPRGPARLVLTMEPFSTKRQRTQRVRVDLNDRRLAELVLDRPGRYPHEIAVPDGALRTHNVLRLLLPDARSPASVGLGDDRRRLGVRVSAVELR